MAFYRDLFTGELTERSESGAGRQIIARIEPEGAVSDRCGSPWSRPWRSTVMSVPIAQMQQFNEDARKHGTGARYEPDPRMPSYARCVCDTRRSRALEMKRRNYKDRQAGYGDYAGEC